MSEVEAKQTANSYVLKVLEHQQLVHVTSPDASDGKNLAAMILELRKLLVEGLLKA